MLDQGLFWLLGKLGKQNAHNLMLQLLILQNSYTFRLSPTNNVGVL
jgi:hypothetical protein